MKKPVGLDDPDDWINRWLGLHKSALFYGYLVQLAASRLEDPTLPDGPGTEILHYFEAAEEFAVRIDYALEDFAKGRVFHVLSIRSAGDPLPPFVDR